MTAETGTWTDLQEMPAFANLELALHAIQMKKGEDVVLLDLRGLSDVADLYLIVSGQSGAQVDTLTRGIMDTLAEAGVKSHHQEGRETSKWVLLDYFDLVIHIMNPDTRLYYRLEELWNDAVRHEVPEDYFADADVAKRHPELQLVRMAASNSKPDPEAEDVS